MMDEVPRLAGALDADHVAKMADRIADAMVRARRRFSTPAYVKLSVQDAHCGNGFFGSYNSMPVDLTSKASHLVAFSHSGSYVWILPIWSGEDYLL